MANDVREMTVAPWAQQQFFLSRPPSSDVTEALSESLLEAPDHTDLRWPQRATADLLLRNLLLPMVQQTSDFRELVKLLGSARHVRTSICGKVSSWAEDRQNECTGRTSQRAQSQWREHVHPAIRQEIWQLLDSFSRVQGDGFELNQKEIQLLLELQGWSLSQVVRNQLLTSLVQEGFLTCRKERELLWYGRVPGREPPPIAGYPEGKLSRWLGALPSTLIQRFRQDEGLFSVFEFWLSEAEVRPFFELVPVAFEREMGRILQKYATLGLDASADDELVWLRWASLTTRVEPAASTLNMQPSLPIAVLAGEIGHLIGSQAQAEQAFRAYLMDLASHLARAQGMDLGSYLTEKAGVESPSTRRRWSAGPLLLQAKAAAAYDGGVVAGIVDQIHKLLAKAWPNAVTQKTMQQRLQSEGAGRIKWAELIELAFVYLDADPQVRRELTPAAGAQRPQVSYRLRRQYTLVDDKASEQWWIQLQTHLESIPGGLQKVVSGDLSVHIAAHGLPVRRADLSRIVGEWKVARAAVVEQLLRVYPKETGVSYPVLVRSFLQNSFVPFYPERIWNR